MSFDPEVHMKQPFHEGATLLISEVFDEHQFNDKVVARPFVRLEKLDSEFFVVSEMVSVSTGETVRSSRKGFGVLDESRNYFDAISNDQRAISGNARLSFRMGIRKLEALMREPILSAWDAAGGAGWMEASA